MMKNIRWITLLLLLMALVLVACGGDEATEEPEAE
jgi:predicted small secreted protein